MVTQKEIRFIKCYVDYKDGKLYCKNCYVVICRNNVFYKHSWNGRGYKGYEYGTKMELGYRLGLHLNSNKKYHTFNRRDMIWMMHNGLIDQDYKVVNVNGDIYDDRIENLKLEKLAKKRAGRKRGLKDQKTRKAKKILPVREERSVIERYHSGVTSGNIEKEFNISASAVRNVILRNKLPLRWYVKKTWKKIDLSHPVSNVVGVYAICAFELNSEKTKRVQKAYFGSSVDIYGRVRDHYSKLINNKHFNTDMQKDFNADDRAFRMYVIEECKEGEELTLESKHLNSVCMSSLYNTWKAPKLDEILPFLRNAVNMKKFKNGYTVNSETGCWEVDKAHKTGYGRLEVSMRRECGKVKYFAMHRVAYWNKTGEYPELVRHLCDNKRCINPDHLESGSHRDNSLDKFREFDKEFENVWVELKADAKKITEYFKWEKCRIEGQPDISSQVYTWERKLGLKEKYPDIYKNSGRRIARSSEEIAKEKEERRLRREEKKAAQIKKAKEHGLELLETLSRKQAVKKALMKFIMLEAQRSSLIYEKLVNNRNAQEIELINDMEKFVSESCEKSWDAVKKLCPPNQNPYKYA